MNGKRQTAAIERAAEMVAALALAAAVAFGLFHAAPLTGFALIGAMALAGAAAGYGGLAAIGCIDRPLGRTATLFTPANFAGDLIDDDELLLDNPVAPAEPQSRVVSLFEPDQPGVLPEPGELATRIADYLDSGRTVARLPVAAEPAREDASAALHAALADIRRSLR